MNALKMCPVCGSENLVIETNKKDYIEIKGEKIEVESKAITCKECNESFATFEDEMDLIERARDIYREKFDIPSPAKISEFMKKYKFSFRDLEKLTGIAFKTIDRYLRGAIPDPSNANLLKTYMRYPEVLLDVLKESVHFNKHKFDTSKEILQEEIDEIERRECAECVFSRTSATSVMPSRFPRNFTWQTDVKKKGDSSWQQPTKNMQDSLAA